MERRAHRRPIRNEDVFRMRSSVRLLRATATADRESKGADLPTAKTQPILDRVQLNHQKAIQND